jgi:type II secretory pathway component PulJ
MSTNTTRWNLVVPKQLDKDLRQLLAYEGRSKKGALSQFVTEAVKKRIFDATHKIVLDRNKNVPYEEIEAAVEESLGWARAKKKKR